MEGPLSKEEIHLMKCTDMYITALPYSLSCNIEAGANWTQTHCCSQDKNRLLPALQACILYLQHKASMDLAVRCLWALQIAVLAAGYQ